MAPEKLAVFDNAMLGEQVVYLIAEAANLEVRAQRQPGVLHLAPQNLNQVQFRRVSR